MILFAEHLWSHVTGGTASLFGILFFEVASYSEVSDPQIAILVQDYVFGLYISVDNTALVDVVEGL